MAQGPDDAKTRALREHGCLNPHAETVRDELFRSNAFFDPRDLLQVRYEMLRRVREDGVPVSHAAASFGVSRPTWYQARRAYEAGGLPGLLPDRPGPRRPHKLTGEVVEALRAAKDERPELTDADLVELVRERFGVSVAPAQHRPRPRPGKKNPMTRRSPCAALATAELSACGQGYERMRRHAVEPGVVHDRHGLAVVTVRGVAAWLHAVAELPVPAAALCGEAPTEPLPAGVERPVVDVLLAMLGGHMERGRA